MKNDMKLSDLTSREQDIAKFISRGYSYKEISKVTFYFLPGSEKLFSQNITKN